jgi:bifunctional non-homologous end joining protein LigD
MKKFQTLETKECPFANLPEAKSGRWGVGLTAAKIKDCRWLKPVLVGNFEFLEWTGGTTCGTRSSSPARGQEGT